MTTARPLRARASRLSYTCTSYTCTSRTRAPPVTLRVWLHTHSCSLERFSLTASIFKSAFPHSLDLYERFSTQPRFARLLRTASRPLLRTLAFSHTSAFSTRPHPDVPRSPLCPHCSFSHERPSARLLRTAPRTLLLSTLLSQVHVSNVPRPLSGALNPHHHSHGHVTPPPCASRSRDRQRRMTCCYACAGVFGGEISPPPRRASIRPAGNVTTRCAFDGECR